jgi:hypothetical protein
MPANKLPFALENGYFVVVQDKIVVSADCARMVFDCGTVVTVSDTATVAGRFCGEGGLIITDDPELNVFERYEGEHLLGDIRVYWGAKPPEPRCLLLGVQFADGTVVRSPFKGAASFTFRGEGAVGMLRVGRGTTDTVLDTTAWHRTVPAGAKNIDSIFRGRQRELTGARR